MSEPHPAAVTVAREIRKQIKAHGLELAEVAEGIDMMLSARQLRRRIYCETIFKAHEVAAIQEFLRSHAGAGEIAA